MHETFLQAAIDEALRNLHDGGGPFGAVIVLADQIIARGGNRVTATFDPTAHAEVVAIRNACQTRRDHRLPDTVIYASTEPCPMCLSAIYWARIDRVYYASTRQDAADAGFDDAALYRELAFPPAERSLPLERIAIPNGDRPLRVWSTLADKVPY